MTAQHTTPHLGKQGLIQGKVCFLRVRLLSRPAGKVHSDCRKEEIMAKTVREAMTPSPRTVSPSTTAVEAARVMDEEDVGSLPVVERDDALVGIVTDRDI